MRLTDGVLEIDPGLDNEALSGLASQISEKLSEIESVTVDLSSIPVSSALFALLVSLKKSKSDIAIPALEEPFVLTEFGTMVFDHKGS